MNFLSSKFTRWSISFLIFLGLWTTVPFLNILWLVIALLHIPLFIRGIIDIRNCFFCHAYCHKDSEKNALALTFDDGPDPKITPLILELLQQFGFKATFFVIAKNAERYPKLTKQICEQGHTIACHDLDHRYTSNFRLTKKMLSEIGEAQKIIYNLTGKKPLLYRPPVGLTNPHLAVALKKLNMYCIGWSGSVGDGGNRFPKRFSLIPELARPGSVVLLHDSIPNENYREQLLLEIEKLFQSIRDKNLSTIGVDELFRLKPYEYDDK